jgi:hypothetical protein
MIRDCIYLADLFLIPMKDMAIILGMDWLEENGAQIDCREKTVSLRSPGGGRIVYQSDRHAHIEVQLQLNAQELRIFQWLMNSKTCFHRNYQECHQIGKLSLPLT